MSLAPLTTAAAQAPLLGAPRASAALQPSRRDKGAWQARAPRAHACCAGGSAGGAQSRTAVIHPRPCPRPAPRTPAPRRRRGRVHSGRRARQLRLGRVPMDDALPRGPRLDVRRELARARPAAAPAGGCAAAAPTRVCTPPHHTPPPPLPAPQAMEIMIMTYLGASVRAGAPPSGRHLEALQHRPAPLPARGHQPRAASRRVRPLTLTHPPARHARHCRPSASGARRTSSGAASRAPCLPAWSPVRPSGGGLVTPTAASARCSFPRRLRPSSVSPLPPRPASRCAHARGQGGLTAEPRRACRRAAPREQAET